MEELILFILSFLFVLLIYEIFIVSPAKKRKKNNITNKEVMEIKYLINRYHIDLDKVNYNQLLQIVSIISSFDISIAVLVVSLTTNFFVEMLLGFVTIILLILISYHIVYLFYKKKGMIKNEF